MAEFGPPLNLPAAGAVRIELGGKTARATIGFYEVLEPHSAQMLATFTKYPGIRPLSP